MHPSQKFEELASALGVAKLWIDEIPDQQNPFVLATWELLNAYRAMIDGDAEWEECHDVMDRIEKSHPEVGNL